MNLIWFLMLISFGCALERESLSGISWSVFSTTNTEYEFNAFVPGGIFSDLYDEGLLPSIHSAYGDINVSWVGLTNWTYTLQFVVLEHKLSENEHINLIFDGLDTFATISLNEQIIGRASNMFVRYIFSAKNHLKVGLNSLSVAFDSPVEAAAAFAKEQDKVYTVPPECPPDEYEGQCNVNQIRKMQASFSWDWGPSLPSVGIWKDVYLEYFNSATIRDVVVTSTKNSLEPVWDVKVDTYLGTENSPAATGNLNVILHLEDGIVGNSSDFEASSNEYGEVVVSLKLQVQDDDVKKWWPNGYGTQNLYYLFVTYTGKNEETDTIIKRIGFRTIELVQEKIGTEGLSFYFKVNGVKMFAKGANAIPIAILPEKGQDKTVIKQVLGTARDTNMNMIRVWGGGVYESDDFYDLADEYGLIVWQDFMFACAMYPTRPDFLKSVTEEVRHQTKRLGSHPSIAIWAGNNENEGALSNNWYNTVKKVYTEDYVKLYVDTIKSELLRVLPSATFITSSPTNGLESDNEGYVARNPTDPLYGDVHFYDYHQDSWNYRTFPVPRFASEYGYQSMPGLTAWMTVTESLADLAPNSDFMQYRQHHPDGNKQNVDLIRLQMDLPKQCGPRFTETFIFYSQILQAESLRIETEHYRSFSGRLNGAGKGNTMGALYWQLNDVWVAPTWSGVDYHGRWKMLQYFVKRFFAPIIITSKLIHDDDLNVDGVEVYVVVDRLDEGKESWLQGLNVSVSIYAWDSLDIQFRRHLDNKAVVGQSVLVETFEANDILLISECGVYSAAVSQCFFTLSLTDNNGKLQAPINYLFPEKLKNSNVQKANVQIDGIKAVSDMEFEVTISTDYIALFVWLDSRWIDGLFSDNGFILLERKKTVVFVADTVLTISELSKALTVVHYMNPTV